MNNRVGFEIARDDFLGEWRNDHEGETLGLYAEPYMDEFGRWCQDACGDDGVWYTLVMIDGDIELH